MDEVLEHLAILRVEAGDTLVYRHPSRLSETERGRVQHILTAEFPGVKVLVLEEGADLGVVRADAQ